MNRKKFLLGGVASAALMAAASAQAATITTHLRLVDQTGAELPKIGNTYQVTPGTTFDVIWGAVVTDPNISEATRGANTASKPLGIQTLAVDIISSGAGRVTPVVTGSGQWDDDATGAYTDLTDPDNLGPQFITTFDKNADGNPDVAAAALVNTNLSLANTATGLRRAQYGITPNVDFNKGEFRATAPGQVTLRTVATAANLFMDPVGGGLELAAQSALSSVVNGEVTINVIGGPVGEKKILLEGTAGPGTVIPLVITGGNGNYVSNTATVTPPAVQGSVNLSAIGQEGPVLAMIQFTDTDPATGDALNDAFLNSIDLGAGNTRVQPGTATFTQLAAHYPILNQPGAALFMIDDPGRFLNFDFTGQGGIAVAAIAAVPEPGIIGALALGGIGLLARRRRNA